MTSFESPRASRQEYIDWLRIIAVLLLIPFHTARIFDIWEPNYVKNNLLSPLLSYQNAFLWAWHMPLFFLLAGASSWYALDKRGAKGYVRERYKRLFIPLVFGLVAIVPPQAYLARFQHPEYAATYWDFLKDYFIIRGDLTGYTGLFTPAHLWFILYLFVFSMVALPLFLYLKRNTRGMVGLAHCCEMRGMIFLAAIPLGIAGALPAISGKNPFYYILLFLYGYLLAGDMRFRSILNRNKTLALVLGTTTMTVAMTLWVLRVHFPEKSAQDILFYSLRTFNTWFWLIAILGFGQSRLESSGRIKAYLNEAAYPFYILHQTVIMLIGYYVVRWDMSVGGKYGLIVFSSFLVTLLIYDLCVRRSRVTRMLFGMKADASH